MILQSTEYIHDQVKEWSDMYNYIISWKLLMGTFMYVLDVYITLLCKFQMYISHCYVSFICIYYTKQYAFMATTHMVQHGIDPRRCNISSNSHTNENCLEEADQRGISNSFYIGFIWLIFVLYSLYIYIFIFALYSLGFLYVYT